MVSAPGLGLSVVLDRLAVDPYHDDDQQDDDHDHEGGQSGQYYDADYQVVDDDKK